MKGFIVHPTYRVKDGIASIHLFGRLENGESFLSIHEYRLYFFIRSSDKKAAEELSTDFSPEFHKSKMKNFRDEPLTKVVLDLPRDVPELRREYERSEIRCYEADIRFSYRFLIDKGLKGTVDIDGEFEKGELVDRIYQNPKIFPVDFKPRLKTLSIDIETNRYAETIFSIALASDDMEKVLLVSKKEVENCEIFADERTMLERLIEIIQEHDPDIITGWNLIDFDLSVLKRRCDNFGIPFKIGRDDSLVKIRQNPSFWRDSTISISGRSALDGISLLKMSFIKLEDYKLDTAAKTFLGESKVDIASDIGKVEEIERMFREDPEKLTKYNLQDAVLVNKILEKKGLIDLTIQRSVLTGMQLDRVNASIASLDNLYIREANKKGYVCNSSAFREREQRIKGGYVRDSKPGIYSNICVLDFKSLYPSIIRTFNIDPLMFISKDRHEKFKKFIEAPNGARFRFEEGILPELIRKLWAQRDDAKQRKNDEESYAVKITMNSFFGVLANPVCRFYSLDMANAITHFGQMIVKTTAEMSEEKGIEVIYGDTDSIFIRPDTDSFEEAKKIGEKLSEQINDYWKDYAKKKGRDSYLELQFEKAYVKFMMPYIRGSEKGSKKRYAGLKIVDGKEKMDFTGLEFVRRDWTALAKEFQLELLNRIFHDKEYEDYIKEFVEDLRKGKLDDLLIYTKALRKKVDSYTKTTPPHVKAARKLEKITSNIIKYVMTIEGPEPIEKIEHSIDYDHYIEKQVRPIAESILSFSGKKFDDILKGSQQTSLFSFG